MNIKASVYRNLRFTKWNTEDDEGIDNYFSFSITPHLAWSHRFRRFADHEWPKLNPPQRGGYFLITVEWLLWEARIYFRYGGEAGK